MKSKQWGLLLLVIGLFIGLLVGAGVPERNAEAQTPPVIGPVGKWEYKMVTTRANEKDFEDAANKVGDEGWELVATTAPVYDAKTVSSTMNLFFKRMKQRRVAGPGGPVQ